jgi:hypothetical protein
MSHSTFAVSANQPTEREKMGKKIDMGSPKDIAKFCKSKGISDTKKFIKLFEKFSDGGTTIDAGALDKIVKQCQ